MMDVSLLPIDIESLKKGDIISLQEIKKMTGLDPDENPKVFDLARLALIAKIDSDLQGIGRQYTVAQVKGEIKILSDEEASLYNTKRLGNALRAMEKSHKKISSVETNNFDEDLKSTHERRVYVSSKFMQSIYNVKKEVKFLPYERNTPIIESS